MTHTRVIQLVWLGMLLIANAEIGTAQQSDFRLNDLEYFERGGVDVMAFQDIYPDGHQGGVSIIQHGVRVATNGDLRLETTPGQWSATPAQLERVVDAASSSITATLAYPDPAKNRTGFNPIRYPDLDFSYSVRTEAFGDAVRVTVDLREPLPEEWVGRVGFNLELFPGTYFGKSWYLGGASGIFPRQPNGPVTHGARGITDPMDFAEPVAFAKGAVLTLVPEEDALRMTIESRTGNLELLDGRVQHNNGWFVVRSLVPAGVSKGAVEWIIRPNALEGWLSEPVIQVSQVGYHPDQKKLALFELDADDDAPATARLLRLGESGSRAVILDQEAEEWGRFLRYDYRMLDFSSVTLPGLYVVEFRGMRSHAFRIDESVFDRDVWQPTLEYFLPVQMCHMRVEEQYRVWHGLCHMDDARLAPADTNHFDGYHQGPELLVDFESGVTVPHQNAGGWHDAGDDDLRIESQADEVWVLSAIYEEFGVQHDDTTIDQKRLLTRIHRPDGVPDLLQQIEHGVLTVLGGYRGLGRFYDGIITPTLRQYVMLGDVANSTDNLFYEPALEYGNRSATHSSVPDDRWVFTETHAAHEYKGIAALAIAARVLSGTNDELARESLAAAEVLWLTPREGATNERIRAATELLLTTQNEAYRNDLLSQSETILSQPGRTAWAIGRTLPLLEAPEFEAKLRERVVEYFAGVVEAQMSSPYGVPYRPNIWGAGWGIQEFGVEQYFLHQAFPESVTAEYMFNALNFVLGVHPGSNSASLVSGVGANSALVGYGLNRADWSYIPGGVVSGTALIRPDFPELKEWPYLWQQVEYVMGGGATNFMFLALAAQKELGRLD